MVGGSYMWCSNFTPAETADEIKVLKKKPVTVSFCNYMPLPHPPKPLPLFLEQVTTPTPLRVYFHPLKGFCPPGPTFPSCLNPHPNIPITSLPPLTFHSFPSRCWTRWSPLPSCTTNTQIHKSFLLQVVRPILPTHTLHWYSMMSATNLKQETGTKAKQLDSSCCLASQHQIGKERLCLRDRGSCLDL